MLKALWGKLGEKRKNIRLPSLFGDFFKNNAIADTAQSMADLGHDTEKLLHQGLAKVKIRLPKAHELTDLVDFSSFLDKNKIKIPDISELYTKPALELTNLQDINKIKVDFAVPVNFEQVNLDDILKSQSRMLEEMLEKQKVAVSRAAKDALNQTNE